MNTNELQLTHFDFMMTITYNSEVVDVRYGEIADDVYVVDVLAGDADDPDHVDQFLSDDYGSLREFVDDVRAKLGDEVYGSIVIAE